MAADSSAPAFVTIAWRGAVTRIEYESLGRPDADGPVIVFLHEGLGSRSMWRDFPARLCEAANARGLVYSRPGYGRSSLPSGEARRDPDYLHRQAFEVLPAFLDAVGIGEGAAAPWLFGHSDGGTIALLHAARHPERTAGIVVVAPHIVVEEATIEGVERARGSWSGEVRGRLARHHDNPDWVFQSWVDIWLDPRFRDWTIEREIRAIRCPVLALQGIDDEYGTLEQIRGIARSVPQAMPVEVADAGHSPHRDRPDVLIAQVKSFLAQVRPGAVPGPVARGL